MFVPWHQFLTPFVTRVLYTVHFILSTVIWSNVRMGLKLLFYAKGNARYLFTKVLKWHIQREGGRERERQRAFDLQEKKKHKLRE